MSIVPRNVTEFRRDGDEPVSRSLRSYRDGPAYVLLGDPGGGKTTAFRTECEALGDRATLITARDFTTFDMDDRSRWRDKTLFIDGLDEVRAGTPDARTPFDEIRRRLHRLGSPRYRLSCRPADWRGENDCAHLSSVTPQGATVTVLRLDPLSETDVMQILNDRADIADAGAFIDTARDRGVDGMLYNPQSLILLANVVAGERGWPASRLDLFEKACSNMIDERNDEHLIASNPLAPANILDAAGRLCAVLAISGAAGYALDDQQADGDYLAPNRCGYPGTSLLHRALATKLFTTDSRGRLVPVHRYIAEFLGAKHLARIIDAGLPAQRVIAFLTGDDGIVVTGQRGVSAWLAALCKQTRREIIERDPIGVISYGDVRQFSVDDKRLLLESLHREPSRLYSKEWPLWAIGAISDAGMEPVFRTILVSSIEADPALMQFVLLELMHGTPLAGITDALLRIVYDEKIKPHFRRMALQAFVHNRADHPDVTRVMTKLLADIFGSEIEDHDDNLTDVALTHLYPHALSSCEVWRYLTEYKGNTFEYGSRFWHIDLLARSTDKDVANLLDSLAARGSTMKSALIDRHLQDLPIEILARGIEAWGDQLRIERLIAWLSVDMFPERRLSSREPAGRIRRWLEQRPRIQKAVVQKCVRDFSGGVAYRRVRELLYGSRFPPDFGRWCLDQATSCDSGEAIDYYLRNACTAVAGQEYDRGLSLEIIIERSGLNERLRRHLAPCLRCDLRPEDFDAQRSERGHRIETERLRRAFVDDVRAHVDALRRNRGPERLLRDLGSVYFGWSSAVQGEDPRQRLDDLFDGDQYLIDTSLAALRAAPLLDDLPDSGDIVSLAAGEQYAIALPFLAGIDEMDDLRQLDDRQLRRAYAFQFCTMINSTSRDREHRLLRTDPAIAAEVLVQSVRAKMRSGSYGDDIANRLAEREYAAVARYAALPLLRSFPLRCARVEGLAMLDEVLRAALSYDKDAALRLIGDKLKRTSIVDTQRVHWLAFGAIANPDRYPRAID